jgi:hypothetical protein
MSRSQKAHYHYLTQKLPLSAPQLVIWRYFIFNHSNRSLYPLPSHQALFLFHYNHLTMIRYYHIKI